MLNPAWSKNLNEALGARYLSKVEDAKKYLFDEIKARSQLETWSPDEQVAHEILNASFLRFEMKANEAEELLRPLFQRASLNDHSRFHLFFQQGLNLDAQSRFAESLEHYQAALKIASNSVERLMCKVNLAVARYHLGIPLNGLVDEIHVLLGENPDHPFREGFRRIELVLLKQTFVNGELEGVQEDSTHGLDQRLYFYAWLGSLPWMQSQFKSQRENFVELCFAEQDLFHKEYRLQTILADERLTKVAKSFNLQSQIDRLYLWMWLWMKNPNSHMRTLLANELEKFPFETSSHHMTSEDFLMVRSLGGWLSLFDFNFRNFFQDWANRNIPKTSQDHPLFFRMDEEVRQTIVSGNWIRKYPSLLEKYKTQKNYIHFVNGLLTPGHHSPLSSRNSGVRVTGNTLSCGKTEIRSQPLARLAILLKNEKRLTFSRVIEFCFEIHPYDSFVHPPKVHNLVARLKKLTRGQVDLYTKDSEVILDDPENLIEVDQISLYQIHFPQLNLSRSSGSNSLTTQKQLKYSVGYRARVSLLFDKQEKLTRKEIQDRLNLSKASTLRWIEAAVSAGHIVKQGHGRVTHYTRIQR